MKKTYILIIGFFLIAHMIEAQNPNFTWAKGMGGTSVEVGLSVTADASGNVYSTGWFGGTVDFDPGAGTFNLTGASANDIYISKLDAAGNFVWAKQIGSTGADQAFSIALDASGNVYTTGYFSGTVDFDPGAGISNMSSVGGMDIFICKLDASGNFVWAKQIGSTLTDIGYSIFIDGSGNVYSTGSFQSAADFDPGAGSFNMTPAGGGSTTDIYVLKLDASGNFIWAKQMGGSATNDEGSSITGDATHVYITGAFAGTGDFDPGAGTFNMTTAGGSDVFISKLDASGNFVWAKQMGGASGDYGKSLVVDGSGNIYSTGNFQTTGDFDPGAGTFNMTSSGLYDIYISKLNSSGNFVWAKQFGSTNGDESYSIDLDPISGCIFTAGRFSLTVDFDPGAGTFNLISGGFNDSFISKLDPSGNYVWAGQITGPSNDEIKAIKLDANANIYCTGLYQATPDFDAGIGTFNITAVASSDIFVMKYCQTPVQPSIINGNLIVCSGLSNTYTIAPVNGATNYTWSLPGGWSGSSATNSISATPGTTGIFTVTANNACGTSPQQTLNVTVNALPSITVNSGSICSGASFTINPNGASTYTFSSGPIVSPTTTSSYSITGTSTAGCVSSSAAISNVTVNPLPTISANTSNTLLCVGQNATLTASGASSYTWNPGGPGTNITVSPTVTANYTITGTDANGCVNSSTFTQNVSTCAGIVTLSGVEAQISVFPNPTSGIITLRGAEGNGSISVYNLLGELVHTELPTATASFTLDLSGQPNGIYFIKIGNSNTKIIKQ